MLNSKSLTLEKDNTSVMKRCKISILDEDDELLRASRWGFWNTDLFQFQKNRQRVIEPDTMSERYHWSD